MSLRWAAFAAKVIAGTVTKTSGATAGFDCTKVANNGSDLEASATLGLNATDWACTRDNVTGLLWEVKTTSGLRSQDHYYTWYNSDASTNAGCYLAPLWSHLDRGLMAPLKSRANGATPIAA